MTNTLRVGMGQPYAVRYTVAAAVDLDPTAPTGATFHIIKQDGTAVTWTAVIETQSAASITVAYHLASSGLDIDQPGTWRGWIQFTEAGASPGPRSEVFTFKVLPAGVPAGVCT